MICNPNSTSQTPELFRQIVPILRGVEGLTMQARYTHRPGHAEEMVRGLTRDDFDAVVAVGGDGTVNEIVNGLLGPVNFDGEDAVHAPDPASVPALAIIPTGSANVFVRALGFASAPVDATELLAQLLAQDKRRTIRLGTWNKRWFAVNAGFGLDADVLARVDKARERGFSATPLRYLSVALKAYRRAQSHPPRINVTATDNKGRRLELDEAPLVLASNTNPWTFLGPMPVVTNPRNSFDKGLGIFGLSDMSGLGGLVGILHLFGVDKRGLLHKISEARTVEFDDAQVVDLECPKQHRFQADGESEGKLTKVRLHSVPAAIEVFAPESKRFTRNRVWHEIVRDFARVR